ncbi:MAG TPA: hypothetical protein VH917_06540 [Ignavibacteriaceae bacterium]
MLDNCRVRIPIRLNCWKHHAGFILKQAATANSESDLIDLKEKLLVIGESQMDLYLGNYSPGSISGLIIEKLKKKNLVDYNQYQRWLQKDNSGYKLVTLPDKSKWTLRLGNDLKRFIHIHTARNSPLTKRVKAAILKTTICFLAWRKFNPEENLKLDVINMLRMNYVSAPPLKSLSRSTGIEKLIKLFDSL